MLLKKALNKELLYFTAAIRNSFINYFVKHEAKKRTNTGMFSLDTPINLDEPNGKTLHDFVADTNGRQTSKTVTIEIHRKEQMKGEKETQQDHDLPRTARQGDKSQHDQADDG